MGVLLADRFAVGQLRRSWAADQPHECGPPDQHRREDEAEPTADNVERAWASILLTGVSDEGRAEIDRRFRSGVGRASYRGSARNCSWRQRVLDHEGVSAFG